MRWPIEEDKRRQEEGHVHHHKDYSVLQTCVVLLCVLPWRVPLPNNTFLLSHSLAVLVQPHNSYTISAFNAIVQIANTQL